VTALPGVETGRERLIIAGLHAEICLTFATASAFEYGYDAVYVTDAAGPALSVSHWYFREAPKPTADVGVAEAEKLAAQEKELAAQEKESATS